MLLETISASGNATSLVNATGCSTFELITIRCSSNFSAEGISGSLVGVGILCSKFVYNNYYFYRTNATIYMH